MIEAWSTWPTRGQWRKIPIDLTLVAWPAPWRPVADESQALSFGRTVNADVAPTVLQELRRELCGHHPLFGIACIPLAYDGRIKKDFLFACDRPDMPLVLVHFTWHDESDPRWPFVIPYGSVRAFIRAERRRSIEPWKLRKLSY